MKKYITLAFTVMIMLSIVDAHPSHTNKFRMRPGKYRQIFYLPQAKNVSGIYRLDTLIESAGIHVIITGARDGDYFKVVVIIPSGRIVVMQQFFYMNGIRSEDGAIDSWFINDKRGLLDSFLLEYFGIIIKPRKQFIKEQRNLLDKTFATAGSFFVQIQYMDKKEKIW